MRWHTWAIGKAAEHVTVASGKMCLICDAVPSCIIYMCWHA